MSVPNLNRLLVLETPQRTEDGAGGYVENWQQLGALWAQVSFRSGRETAQQETAISSGSFRITVRGAPFGAVERPRPDQRFVDGLRIYHIKAVAEADDHGRYLTCYATEESTL
ncbi:MAG: head-tail adaptor protein [Pseudomonadota bacterium]